MSAGPDFSPRGLGRLLDDALALYGANFRALVVPAAVLVFPFSLLAGVANSFYLRGIFALFPILSGQSPDAGLPAEYWQAQAAGLVSNAAAPLYTLGRLAFIAAVYAVVPSLLAGAHPDWRTVLKGGWRRYLLFIAVYFSISFGITTVGGIAGAATFFLLGIPGLVLYVYLLLRLSVATEVVVAEGARYADTFRRSWDLTRGRVWRTFPFAVALGVVSAGLQAVVGAPAALRQIVVGIQDPESVFQQVGWGWKLLDGLSSAASVTLVVPFVAIAWYLYYVDLRARREGMDLLARAQRLAREPR